MFPIKKQLASICIILAFVVSTSLGQSRLISPDYLKGEWVGSFSWKRDTTSYPTTIDFRSPGICRLSIMDGKVNLALQVESLNQTQTSYIVDPDMSDPNPLFISARLTITKLSDYISCVYRIAFAFEGEEEQWGGFLFRIR
jgi:hypothetical protein